MRETRELLNRVDGVAGVASRQRLGGVTSRRASDATVAASTLSTRRRQIDKRTRRAHLLARVRERPADERAVDLEAADDERADLEERRVLLADLGQVIDGRARHVGEERVPRLGDEEADDGEHGHAAVLGLGLAVAADVVVRRLGREARRVPLAHGRERAGQVEAEALLGGEAGREAVRVLGDLVELALRGELRRGATLADGATRAAEGATARARASLERAIVVGCLRARAGQVSAVSCNVVCVDARPRAAAVERRAVATPRNVAQRTRMCCAVLCATRERAATCAARFLLAADAANGMVRACARRTHGKMLGARCTNERMGALSSTRDVATDAEFGVYSV